ncbi:MAG: hypothetical protein ACXW27_04115 [Allosphingosinicella sp.]
MIHQRRLSEWPIGLEQDAVVLSLGPLEITRRAGISFERAHDNLDDFDGAVLELEDGKVLALQHYLNSPVYGTKLILWREGDEGLREAIELLDVKPTEVSWIAPQLENSLAQALKGRQEAQQDSGVSVAAAVKTAASLALRSLFRRMRVPH